MVKWCPIGQVWEKKAAMLWLQLCLWPLENSVYSLDQRREEVSLGPKLGIARLHTIGVQVPKFFSVPVVLHLVIWVQK